MALNTREERSSPPSKLIERLNQERSTIDEIVRITKTPALSFGVVYDGSIVYTHSLGKSNLSQQSPCTSDTAFAISSLTKSFTATACALLVIDGALNLDTPISHYVPTFAPSHPDIAACATVRDALNHTTGLPDPYPLYTGFDGKLRFVDEDSLVRLVNSLQGPSGNFRSNWTYNSLVYSLLGLIIETVSKLSFADFLTSRILVPLGMRDSSILTLAPQDRDSSETVASGYVVLPEDDLRELPITQWDNNYFAASFGMSSSTNDQLRWAKAVIDAHRDDTGPVSTPYRQVLAAIRLTMEPGCQIRIMDQDVMSYRAGWFHTVGQMIDFNIFYDPLVGSTPQEHPLMTTKANGEDTTTTSQLEDMPAHESRSILYSNGYCKGFTSCIYVYPDLGHAVVVLGNSTGRSEPCGYVSRLLAALVCGDSIQSDSIAALQEEVEEFASRWTTLYQAFGLATSQYHPISVDDHERYAGYYRDVELGFGMRIFACSKTNGLMFCFDDQPTMQLGLWEYKKHVLCFFPPEAEFTRKIMPPFADTSQYLLHMQMQADHNCAWGLWWQYDRGVDASWLEKQTCL